jgi:hypothetical protein
MDFYAVAVAVAVVVSASNWKRVNMSKNQSMTMKKMTRWIM